MEHTLARDFLILSLNPESGRLATSSIEFRYCFTGALLMEYLNSGELSLQEKRLVPSFRMKGDPVHDLIAEKFAASSVSRKIPYWIRKLTAKSRFLTNNFIIALERERVLRIEHRKFLGIFPYRRYFLNNTGIRLSIIETLRGILLHGRQPSGNELMLLALMEPSRLFRRLSRERGEIRAMKRKARELLKGDIVGAEISQTIREVKAAIAASVMVATMASHGSH